MGGILRWVHCFSREAAVDESKTMEDRETIAQIEPKVDDGYEAWMAEPVPQYAIEAYEGFLADLMELLAHREANPTDRWVAYRGRQRLGFGNDQHLFTTNVWPDSQTANFAFIGSASNRTTIIR
jgi:hypothetical protein